MNILPHPQARRQFSAQKARAKHRGIEWRLTLDEWLSIWVESGRYEQRGRGAGKYVMARLGDRGPYEVGNVFISSSEQNFRDGLINSPTVRGGSRTLGLGRGWTFDSGSPRKPYRANYRGKRLGSFPTATLAEAAYAAAHNEYLNTQKDQHAFA